MMDTSVKVALIVAIPSTITSIGTLVLGLMNRSGLKEVHESVNGKLKQLIETSGKLSHAEGRREGVEATEAANNRV